MGIATDIVIQQRHRQNKGTGDEAAAAEIEAQEEDLEDVREALRGRLYQPVSAFQPPCSTRPGSLVILFIRKAKLLEMDDLPCAITSCLSLRCPPQAICGCTAVPAPSVDRVFNPPE